MTSSSNSNTSRESQNNNKNNNVNVITRHNLDFIGCHAHAVKTLLSLPYLEATTPVSVAVHNFGGTLLMDVDDTVDVDAYAYANPTLFVQQRANLSSRQDQGIHGVENNNMQQPECEDKNNTTIHGLLPNAEASTITTTKSTSTDNATVPDDHHHPPSVDDFSRALVALSTLEERGSTATVNSTKSNRPISPRRTRDALSLLQSVIVQHSKQSERVTLHDRRTMMTTTTSRVEPVGGDNHDPDRNKKHQELFQQQEQQSPYLYHHPHEHEKQRQLWLPPAPENPREYLSWTFADHNLLIGSDALIYRSPDSTSAGTASTPSQLAIRVEDVRRLQALLQQHEQTPKFTYADMTRRNLPSLPQSEQSDTKLTTPTTKTTTNAAVEIDKVPNQPSSNFKQSPADLNVPLQTCIVPMPNAPVGALLRTASAAHESSTSSSSSGLSSSPSSSSSPVSTVLDVYLDNIMANVPQLALCLQDKGFIQSVKLLATEQVPSQLLHPSTLDTTKPFAVMNTSDRSSTNPSAERFFSPQCIETHASSLLRFLKTHCSRDHSTYLLRRDAGQTTIQLYDISNLSSQGQRKWIWWLAMMSLRFAHRLGQLLAAAASTQSYPYNNHKNHHQSNHILQDAALQRDCRARQRRLLETTLELLDMIADLDGSPQESLVSAVHEKLADLYLSSPPTSAGLDHESMNSPTKSKSEERETPTSLFSPVAATLGPTLQQPYASSSIDALTKAQDHLTDGIKALMPKLKKHLKDAKIKSRREKERDRSRSLSSRVTVMSVKSDDASSSDDDNDDSDQEGEAIDDTNGKIDENSTGTRSLTALKRQISPIVTQLFGLHYKFVNVSLRIAEIHLRNYYSSSAMQALRASARRIADSLHLVQLLANSNEKRVWLDRIQPQYTWLWEHCGHFARSFAGDELWRDRGHASGDDVISVLRDAERAFTEHQQLRTKDRMLSHRFIQPENPISVKSKGLINLQSLVGLVNFQYAVGSGNKKKHGSSYDLDARSMEAATSLLDDQRVLLRDKRRVLIAACVAYCRSIQSFRHSLPNDDESQKIALETDSALLKLLHQRLGDACNESGKIMLNELRSLLATETDESALAAVKPLLAAAQFWFFEGLAEFEQCRDLRNLALLRCNLCQSFKLQANATFAPDTPPSAADGPTHAELCLQEAANQLQAAHASLGQREVEPRLWDMVSEELAATFLVLGVRRRQSLIGSGNMPVIMQALRLSTGKEHSIVDPMQRAMTIYEQLGNNHQSAAAHYQLALFYSKIWTCQSNEARTREKLSAAFQHYISAHAFFSQSVRGNEVTFCLLCCDISSLYAAVAGEECTVKAMLCCFDVLNAVSKDAIDFVLQQQDQTLRSDWFSKMETLASTLDERVFKLLRTLVKLEEEGSTQGGTAVKYKDLYRAGLLAKMEAEPSIVFVGDPLLDKIGNHLLKLHNILSKLRDHYDKMAGTRK